MCKRVWFILTMLWLSACLTARSSVVIFNVTNFINSIPTSLNIAAITNTQIAIQPVGPVMNSGTAMVRGYPTVATIVNGFGTNTLLSGNFSLELQLPDGSYSQPVYIAVPNDTLTYNATDLQIPGKNIFAVSGVRKITSNDRSITLSPANGVGTVDLSVVSGADPNAAHLTNLAPQNFLGPIVATGFTGPLAGNATTASGAPPMGAAGGLLAGTYPNPTLSGAASLPSSQLSGANNYALFGLGLVHRTYQPSGSVALWGTTPVFSSDIVNWKGGSGYPQIYCPTNSLRDSSMLHFGAALYSVFTCGVSDNDVHAPFAVIYKSTNGGGLWSFVTTVSFTNAIGTSTLNRTWGPEFFLSNGIPCIIASCFFTDSTPHAFRVAQCLNTNTFSIWSAATNVNMVGITSGTANDPFLYDDTANSGNWYLWTANTQLSLYRSSSPLGPWTGVMNLSFNGGDCEGPAMLHLPDGRFLLLFDEYFNGYECLAMSSAIETGWSSLTNIGSLYQFGHFTPIILTNLQDIAAAEQAAVPMSANWNPHIDSPTWASGSDVAGITVGPRSQLSGSSPNLRWLYHYGLGWQADVTGYAGLGTFGEDGFLTLTGNGLKGSINSATNLPITGLSKTGSSPGQIATATASGVAWSNAPPGITATNFSTNFTAGQLLVLQLPHGFGSVPSVARAVIVCNGTDSASGYVSGQEMDVNVWRSQSDNGPEYFLYCDATYVYVTEHDDFHIGGGENIVEVQPSAGGAFTQPSSLGNFQHLKVYLIK